MSDEQQGQQPIDDVTPSTPVAPDAAANAAPSGSAPAPAVKRIYVDRDLCIGASSCVAVAPGVFQLDGEGKAYVVAEEGADEETIRLAAESCPVKAIFLKDKEGKQVYP